MAKHNSIKFGSVRLSKLSNKCENELSFEKHEHEYVSIWQIPWTNAMVVVSHTRKNYSFWALSDWAIKANVWVLTFAPPPPPVLLLYYLLLINISPQVFVQYMKFARRAEGISAARAVFKRAREDKKSTYHVSYYFVTWLVISTCHVGYYFLKVVSLFPAIGFYFKS